MSADRYEITDNDASIRCQKHGKGPLILYACDHDSSTQKIIAVIRQLRSDLAAVTAERDSYRDQFSGLCLTLSVGSEGRPGMTAEDWRRRVDEGIDFLTRPLIAEISKRSKMLDICTQNCSDWIGKWRAEQERAEQAEAQLAEYAEAPTLAMFCPITESAISSPELMAAYRSSLIPQIELIARKVKK